MQNEQLINNRFHDELRQFNRKLDTNLLSQIQEGIGPSQYLIEGLWIMQDVSHMLDQIRQGKYNNYLQNPALEMSYDMISNGGGRKYSVVSPPSGINLDTSTVRKPAENSKKNQQAFDDVSTHFDVQSNAGLSMISRGTMKARREVQIRKLEMELMRITKRYEQVTDPIYISELRSKLKQMEKGSD